MAPRKNAKRTEDEAVEMHADGDGASPHKKKKTATQNNASESSEDIRSVRLPRAAKNKKPEPVSLPAEAAKKPAKKTTKALSKEAAAKDDKATLKKSKTIDDEPSNSKTSSKKLKNADEEPVKKSRGKAAGIKNAGTDVESKADAKPKGRSRKNVDDKTDTADTEKKSTGKAKGKQVADKESKDAKPKGKGAKKAAEPEEESTVEPPKKVAKGKGKTAVANNDQDDREDYEEDPLKAAKGRRKKGGDDANAVKPATKKGRPKKAVVSNSLSEDELEVAPIVKANIDLIEVNSANESPIENDELDEDTAIALEENGTTEDAKENGDVEINEEASDEPRNQKKRRAPAKKTKASAKTQKSDKIAEIDSTNDDEPRPLIAEEEAA